MRIIISVAVTVLAATFMPSRAQDTCYVVECWPIPGGQRCHHRCFHPQPQYYAPAEDDDSEPVYQEPDYETPEQEPQEETPDAVEPTRAYEPPDEPEHYAPQPRYEQATGPPDPAATVAFLAVLGVIALGLIAVFSSSPSTDDIDAIDADIAKTAELAAKLEAAAREADAHLAAFRKEGGHFDGDSGHG